MKAKAVLKRAHSRLTSLRLTATAGFLDFNVGNLVGTDTKTNDIPQNLADRIVDILSSVAYPLAVVAILYSAFALVSSMGNPDAYAKAKKNVTYVTTGIFLIIFAGVLFRFARSLFSAL